MAISVFSLCWRQGNGDVFSSSSGVVDSWLGSAGVDMADLLMRAGSFGVLKVGRPGAGIRSRLVVLDDAVFRDPSDKTLGSILPATVVSQLGTVEQASTPLAIQKG